MTLLKKDRFERVKDERLEETGTTALA